MRQEQQAMLSYALEPHCRVAGLVIIYPLHLAEPLRHHSSLVFFYPSLFICFYSQHPLRFHHLFPLRPVHQLVHPILFETPHFTVHCLLPFVSMCALKRLPNRLRTLVSLLLCDSGQILFDEPQRRYSPPLPIAVSWLISLCRLDI